MFQVPFLKWSQYVWDEFIRNFSQNIPLGFRMKLRCIYRLTSLRCYPFVLRNMMWFIDVTFFTKVLHACGYLLCFVVWFLWLLGISSQLYFLSSYYLQRNYRLLPVYLRIGFLIKFSLFYYFCKWLGLRDSLQTILSIAVISLPAHNTAYTWGGGWRGNWPCWAVGLVLTRSGEVTDYRNTFCGNK